MSSGMTPNSHASYISNKIPGLSPFLAKMTKRTKNSRNDMIPKSTSNYQSQHAAKSFKIPMSTKSSNKSRNGVLNQIKTSVHTKTNSDNFFNIPCNAYGTDAKPKQFSSRHKQKSGSKLSSKSDKKASFDVLKLGKVKYNPLQVMIANKLYNDMVNNQANMIIPGNNSSGTSTQGSSTKDFKSSAKKRKQQQECYYLSNSGKNMFTSQGEMHPNVVRNLKLSKNFQPEGLSPNIFIVEDPKRSSMEPGLVLSKPCKSFKNLSKAKPSDYNFVDVGEGYDMSMETSDYKTKMSVQKQPKAYQTIESDDRNL